MRFTGSHRVLRLLLPGCSLELAMPRKRLTDTAVRALETAERQVTHWDAALPCFGLRIAPGGAKTWIVQYRAGGRVRRLKLGRYPLLPLADARDKAKVALAAVTQGDDPA